MLDDPLYVIVWGATALAAFCLYVWDVRKNNPELGAVMRLVWGLTTVYSGFLGLAAYYYCGRKQIAADSLPRRGLRSTSHCYAGCGAGEVIGVVVTQLILGLGPTAVAIVTFALAYVAGLSLTVLPLLHDGEPLGASLKDALISESASITVMELVALGVGTSLGAGTALAHPRFWSSMVVSLSAGLVAAYPVNVLLIHLGVKEGMHDPRAMAAHSG